MSLSTTAVPVLNFRLAISKVITASGIVAASGSLLKFVSAAMTATGIILGIIQTRKIVPGSASGVVVLQKQPRISSGSTGVGIPGLAKQVAIIRSSVATGIVSSTHSFVKVASAILTATGILSLISRTNKISATISTGVGVALTQARKNFSLSSTGILSSTRQTIIVRASIAVANVVASSTLVKLTSAALTAVGLLTAAKEVRKILAIVATAIPSSYRGFSVQVSAVAHAVLSAIAYLGMQISTYAETFMALPGRLAFNATRDLLFFYVFIKKLFFKAER
jgi:hypothetical protein